MPACSIWKHSWFYTPDIGVCEKGEQMLNRSVTMLAGALTLAVLLGTVSYAQESGRVNQIDVLFVNEMAWGAAAEISVNQIARQFAFRPETRQYAQRIVNEHTEALSQLVQLANEKAILLPPELVNSNNVQPQRIAPNQLNNARERFDIVYLLGQIATHEKLIGLLQSEVMNAGDQELREFATRNLRMVEAELRLARRTMFIVLGTDQTPAPDTPEQ